MLLLSGSVLVVLFGIKSCCNCGLGCSHCVFCVLYARRMETVKYTGRMRDKEHEKRLVLYVEVSTRLVDEVLRESQVHIQELSQLLRGKFHHTLMALHPDWRCAQCKSRARGAVNGMMLVCNHRPLHVVDHVLPVCVAGGVCMRELVVEFRKYPELLPMLIFE